MITTIILCGIVFYVGYLRGKNPEFFKEYKRSLLDNFSKKSNRKEVKKPLIKKKSSDESNIVSLRTYKKRKK